MVSESLLDERILFPERARSTFSSSLVTCAFTVRTGSMTFIEFSLTENSGFTRASLYAFRIRLIPVPNFSIMCRRKKLRLELDFLRLKHVLQDIRFRLVP